MKEEKKEEQNHVNISRMKSEDGGVGENGKNEEGEGDTQGRKVSFYVLRVTFIVQKPSPHKYWLLSDDLDLKGP
jgi:hypothetical protein